MTKGILFACAALAVALVMSTNVFAIDIFFEHRDRQQVARGVEYEFNRMMTSRGMLDVHVLTVNVRDPYVSLGPVSAAEAGRRDTTLNMLRNAGAVAGVNADFSDMAGSHTVLFGPMANDGQLLAINATVNNYTRGLATFMLDVNNNPFFRYLQADIRFYNNGAQNIRISAYNTVGTQLLGAVVVDRLGMYDTSAIDARLPGLPKIIVEGSVITYISAPGQTVTVPANGYVVILPAYMAYSAYMNRFNVGDLTWLHVGTDLRIDFSQIQAAIGGGGLILANGETVSDEGLVIAGRQPRSAVGATRNGRIILMTVDGRSHSVGVTHSELADILRHYGVTDAMHFDGGGSATMVTQGRDGSYSVVNTLSDGSQRRVINALGVFDNSPRGPFSQISLEMAGSRAILGVPIAANVYAMDSMGNTLPININRNQLIFSDGGASGSWDSNGRYTPFTTGLHLLEVWYGNFRGTTTIYVYQLAELQPRLSQLNLMEGGRSALRFSGIAVDGTRVDIPAITGLTVHPSYLGHFDGNYFVATTGGSGYIAASIGSVRTYIGLSVGGLPWPMDIPSTTGFFSYPAEYVSGTVTSATESGRGAVHRLNYSFSPVARTQAAYLTFYPPIAVPGDPVALRIDVNGDGSGHWLRARVRDDSGQFHNIDFTRNANFTGWQTLTAMMPATAPAPFTLDRIYMVTLSSEVHSSHSVAFDNLQALFAPTQQIPVPQGTVFSDALRAAPDFIGAVPPFEFTVPTSATPYNVLPWSGLVIVNLSAASGGIAATDINQWGRFMNDIRSAHQRNVVILMDANPRNFRQSREYELFHAAMAELRSQGRLVFVVSSTGSTTSFNMRDGVRYIDVARPAEGIPTIRFWIDGEQIMWSD